MKRFYFESMVTNDFTQCWQLQNYPSQFNWLFPKFASISTTSRQNVIFTLPLPTQNQNWQFFEATTGKQSVLGQKPWFLPFTFTVANSELSLNAMPNESSERFSSQQVEKEKNGLPPLSQNLTKVDKLAKRLFDILVSGTLLMLLSPFLLLVVILIRLDSSGAVLFSQSRIGKKGVLFKMWKFRSMYKDAEHRKAALLKLNEMKNGVLFKMKKDPRITRVGRFIRKYSIDEIPQLWNVFTGDMSLVGPRPAIPSEVAQYTPYQRQRLQTTPGITCIWQVSGRSEIPFEQQVEMDLEYIRTQSFWNDMILLLKTLPAVIKAKGAF